MSKNRPTIEHLRIACRHVDELVAAGVTENHAIRTLELFADVYAKTHNGGSASPHHVDQVKFWSVQAIRLKQTRPQAKPKDWLRVEHGTPRRTFARKVMALFHQKKLTEQAMNRLVKRFWKLAVITLEEDGRLNKLSKLSFKTPEERWAAAAIKFPRPSKSPRNTVATRRG
jgi:hypothetical protein